MGGTKNPAYSPATETHANAGVSIFPFMTVHQPNRELGSQAREPVSQARASTSDAEACLALLVTIVRTGGVEIAYERVREGPPLVFVQGAADDGRVWQPQLDALADEFTVVAWDEPGAGRSSDVPTGFNLVDYANCLAALIEALALAPAHIAGASWGGTVALELYRHHPQLVASLIL